MLERQADGDVRMTEFTDWSMMSLPPEQKRYNVGARWFHWITTLLIFVIVPLGWIFAEFKTMKGDKNVFEAPIPGSPADYASLHKTLGLIVLAIVAARIVYRIFNRPPPLPGTIAAAEKGLAHATHWLLYLVLLVMPISGYIMSSAGDHPISIFWLFDFPKLPISKDQGKVAHNIHIYAQFAVYALVILHLAGVSVSLFLRRDNILGRMLPRQANAE